MSQIVPLISSGIAGPLGVLHLPRLWQKASLAAAGKLHADYPGIGCGYDQMTLDALGINIDHVATVRQARKADEPDALEGEYVDRFAAALRGYVRLAQLQFEGGRAPYSTVMQAQEQLFPAELDWAASRAQLCVSLVGIYKAMGGGWVDIAADMAPISSWRSAILSGCRTPSPRES